MPINPELEQQLNQTKIRKKELALEIESVDRELDNILSEIGTNFEELNQYVSKEENFSKPIWEKLQEEKQKLDAKLCLDLSQAKDPTKLKKKLAERGAIQSHWIFVR